jgi:DNA-directed RNA polymerase I subunit RPA2
VHLSDYGDKLEYLLFMLRKLYSFAAGDCGVDNADSLQNQEILLPGHLMSTFVKEKFDETLANIRLGLLKEMRMDFVKVSLVCARRSCHRGFPTSPPPPPLDLSKSL